MVVTAVVTRRGSIAVITTGVVVITGTGVVTTGVVVMTGRAAMVSVVAEVTAGDPIPLDALTVKVKLPAVVGVPDNRPVDGFKVSPAGNAPEAIANVGAGLPVAV